MNRNEVVSQLSTSVSKLIGHEISVDNVHTDQFGWFDRIPVKSLPSFRPIIISDSRGNLSLVLPTDDLGWLKHEVFSIQDYIDSSVWSYGYYNDISPLSESVLYRFRWQPLETSGIHDTEMVSRYISYLLANGTNPHYIQKVRHVLRIYKEDPKNIIRVEEVDDRIALYLELSRKIQNRFGFETRNCDYHDRDDVIIVPNELENVVDLYLPQYLMVDLLCNPGKYSVKELASSLMLEISIPTKKRFGSYFFPSGTPVTEETTTQHFYEIWKKECPDFVDGWFPKEDVPEIRKDVEVSSIEVKTTFVRKALKWFKQFFHLDCNCI